MSIAAILADQNPWWSDPAHRPREAQLRRRRAQPRLLAQILSDSRRAQVLLGPRQVGKTTILYQSIFELLTEHDWPARNITYFDFSDDRLIGQAASPRDVVAHEPDGLQPSRPRLFFLDEIGHFRGWAEWLKQTVDRTDYRIAATDSAATLLREGGRESGMGRWDEIQIEGLTYAEFLGLVGKANETAEEVASTLPGAFERYVAQGGFPEHAGNDSLADVRRRLREDIADKAIFRDLMRYSVDLPRVKDLFVYLMELSGAILDPQDVIKMLRSGENDKPPDKRSIEKYLHLLEDTFLVRRLDPFGWTSAIRLTGKSRPKIYAADHALVTAFASVPEPTRDPDVRGKVFEAMVFRHLREAGARNLGYFRHDKRSGELEIDFLFETDRGRVAVEVTSAANPGDKVGSLKRIVPKAGACRALIVTGGYEPRTVENIQIVPAQHFLLNPATYLQGD